MGISDFEMAIAKLERASIELDKVFVEVKMMRFPRKYQFKTDRQYRLALRKWRSENSARIKEAERQCPKF